MTERYSVRLESFEGPLDLLLHLVRKHEVNLYEVSVAAVTEQYLAYLAAAKDLNLDVAGEYVLMAATLIYLKSRALLPPEEREDLEEEEPLDPELELIEQLLEYERYQAVASNLASRPVLGRDVFERRVVESVPGLFSEPFRALTPGDLLTALDRLLARRAHAVVHHVNTERLSIRDGIDLVIEILRVQRRCAFDALFPPDASRLRIVVTFLAILELMKHGALVARQERTFGEFEVELLREVDADKFFDVDFQEAAG